MDIKEIKQIIDLMKRSDLTEFEIEEQNLKLRIKREPDLGNLDYSSIDVPAPLPVAMPMQSVSIQGAPSAAPVNDKSIAFIKSPMVGTFYKSPSPDTAAFANVGSKMNPESICCIIEAMKVMNEIQAELKGTILEILVENGQAVEFGQALFKVKVD
ncbi:MAG: acetyl-CoA carboxylase, biotin carboxyl carrier protein [Verrucomicrobia bacterium GWC2_42_7]|nr:MAG: acetyl-CoA carboxylase, biotin carboxyl carrier protein [Verrucomicrobia bacterium GWC2_42_7]